MDGSWQHLSSAPRYARGRLALREDIWRLPDGQELVYPVLVVGVTVGVLPFVDADHVLLIRQFRHLLRTMSWELPGGGAGAGEDPLTAAQRELREEGGYRAGRLELLTHFHPSTAYLDEIAYCYAGHDLRPDPLPADGDEFIERRVFSFAEALRMALDGEITESVSKLTILQYAVRRSVPP